MKSLFLRLLVSLWLAMALLVGAFALIHAWAFPPEATPPRMRGAELRADNALLCTRLELDGCERSLRARDRKSTRLNSSHSQISYAVFCLKKKKKKKKTKKEVQRKRQVE